ncbi:MAG: hypothetical protein Q8N47_05630 [Bryobacterales bacterium]|nr:hypothetical protein [Bryobacterales bacterium]
MTSTRILGVMALLAAGAVVYGAEAKSPRRLESITWSPSDHKLSWVISSGTKDTAGKYKPVKSQTYNIDMSAATMTLNGEGRRFSRDEAKNVQVLMDLVSKYAVESTVWWDQGQGTPLGKENKNETDVNQQQPRRTRPAIPPRRPADLVKTE